MPDDPQVTGGAGGEPPVTAEAPSSQTPDPTATTVETQEPAPDPRAELYKQLGEIDPRELPDNIRQKLEMPFLQQYGKKTTELDQERQKFLGLIERLMPKQATSDPATDPKRQLLDEINNGNFGAIENLVNTLVEERTGPQLEFLAQTKAVQEAAQLMPELPKYANGIMEDLNADPMLAFLAQADKHKYGSRILAGLAWRRNAIDLAEQLKAERASRDSAIKKGIEEHQAKLKGLPSSTTQAGKTTTAYPSEKPMTFKEAFEAAWAEQKGA